MDLMQAINNIQRFTGEFPEEEVKVIRENREQAIPILLDVLKAAMEIDDYDYAYDVDTLNVLFLLSEFEVYEACDMMIEILTKDEDTIDFYIGDALTENYNVMLANVMKYDDIPKLIQIINNKNYYEFARTCAVNTLLALTVAGKLDYEELGRIFETLIEENFDDEDIAWCFAINVKYICTQKMQELIDKQFREGIINTREISRIDFSIDCMEKDKKNELFNNEFMDKSRGVIDTLKTWACYSSEEERQENKARFAALENAGLTNIILNSSVNRNLDGSLLDCSGVFLSIIGRKYGYYNISEMTADEALRIVHDTIINELYDNLVNCNKESYELFMKCYNQDIVKLSRLSNNVIPMFESGIFFGTRNDDYTVNCYITDDVKRAAKNIFENNGFEKLRIDKMNNGTSFKELKIGRNDPCPCGSGKKYKKCCGR